MANSKSPGAPIDVAGFEGRGLAVRPAGLFSSAVLICDGAPVAKTGAAYELKDNAGATVTFRFGQTPFDPIPKVIVRDQVIDVAPPLAWHQYLWVLLPVALVFIGGLLGGVVGAAAAFANLHLIRQPGSVGVRYAITGLITVGALVAWLLVASLVQVALGAV